MNRLLVTLVKILVLAFTWCFLLLFYKCFLEFFNEFTLTALFFKI